RVGTSRLPIDDYRVHAAPAQLRGQCKAGWSCAGYEYVIFGFDVLHVASPIVALISARVRVSTHPRELSSKNLSMRAFAASLTLWPIMTRRGHARAALRSNFNIGTGQTSFRLFA